MYIGEAKRHIVAQEASPDQDQGREDGRHSEIADDSAKGQIFEAAQPYQTGFVFGSPRGPMVETWASPLFSRMSLWLSGMRSRFRRLPVPIAMIFLLRVSSLRSHRDPPRRPPDFIWQRNRGLGPRPRDVEISS